MLISYGALKTEITYLTEIQKRRTLKDHCLIATRFESPTIVVRVPFEYPCNTCNLTAIRTSKLFAVTTFSSAMRSEGFRYLTCKKLVDFLFVLSYVRLPIGEELRILISPRWY